MQDAELLEGSNETWQNGQDSSQNVQDMQYSELESSLEQSSEIQYVTLSQDYDLGMFADISGTEIFSIMSIGIVVGFAFTILLGYISKWIADTWKLFGTSERGN